MLPNKCENYSRKAQKEQIKKLKSHFLNLAPFPIWHAKLWSVSRRAEYYLTQVYSVWSNRALLINFFVLTNL